MHAQSACARLLQLLALPGMRAVHAVHPLPGQLRLSTLCRPSLLPCLYSSQALDQVQVHQQAPGCDHQQPAAEAGGAGKERLERLERMHAACCTCRGLPMWPQCVATAAAITNNLLACSRPCRSATTKSRKFVRRRVPLASGAVSATVLPGQGSVE